MYRAFLLLYFFLLAPAYPADINSPVGVALTVVTMDALDDKHKLAAGDRVSFRIVEDQDDVRSLFVADSGDLEVPYMGRYPVIDKTCKQAATEIKAELEKKLYYQATVIIAVDQMSKSRGKVYLAGSIRAPGPQDIPSDEVFTISKAIMRAGGFTEFADKKRVKLARKAGRDKPETDTKVIIVNVSEILEKGKADKDLVLESGDLIVVPSRSVNF